MDEKKFIEMFARVHGTSPFKADAEQFGGMIYSIDGFSKNEDFFANTPAKTVGHNMAAAACADLLACGACPQFLVQSWNIDPSDDFSLYEKMAEGVEEVLWHYGAKCIGGDIGVSRPWSWTATVGAQCPDPVRRIASKKEPFDLYITGALGGANLACFLNGAIPEIALRSPVKKESLFATDTSGGFFDALENIARANPDISIELGEIPTVPMPSGLNLPRELLLIGGVGEYEILYALPKSCKSADIRIGGGSFSGGGIRFKCGKKLSSPVPDYRNIAPENRLLETLNFYKEIFG